MKLYEIYNDMSLLKCIIVHFYEKRYTISTHFKNFVHNLQNLAKNFVYFFKLF
jgi:hypothetical protein